MIDSNEEEEWVLYMLRDGREWRDGSKPVTLYWHHPESGSLFTTTSESGAGNESGS